jgi:acetyl-CoA C-acetyltransferase
MKGWGHTSSRISYADKVKDSESSTRIFPHVEQAIHKAWKLANIKQVWELDGIETHDCFSISQYMAIDHFGLVEPGQSWQAIENEWITLGNKLPFNASGGLIGCGHPVGATGVRMVLDAWKQTTNQAGDYQIENARNIGTLNLGGSATAVVSFVVGT